MQKEHSGGSLFLSLKSTLFIKKHCLVFYTEKLWILYSQLPYVVRDILTFRWYQNCWNSFHSTNAKLFFCTFEKFAFDIVTYFPTFSSSKSFFFWLDDDQKYKDLLNFLFNSKYDISTIYIKHLFPFAFKAVFWFNIIPWFSLAIFLKNLTVKATDKNARNSHPEVFLEKSVLKYAANLQENTHAKVRFR